VKQTEKAVKIVNKKVVKVHIVKKVGVTTTQVKKAVQEKKVIVTGKKVVVNKKKVVVAHKETEKKVVVEHKETENKVAENKVSEKKVDTSNKKVLVDKIVQHEDHKNIKQEIKHHASECGCAESTTPAEKSKCRTECESRSVVLKKKVNAHVAKETNCQSKAVIACGDSKSKKCLSCKKSFILVCVSEETKRRNELVSLLEECDSFLLEPSVNESYKTVIFQA